MALTPEVEKLLADLPPAAELSQYTPEIARRRLVETAPVVKGGDDRIEIRNFEIEGPNGKIPMRSYIPRIYLEDGQPLPPVAIHLHGGGFVTGSIDLYDANTRDLAARSNCAVVAVGYGLAPEHPFPEGLHDCYAATEWIARNGKTIGVDPSRIAIGGSSAGANLATSVCLMARDQGGPKIAFQFLVNAENLRDIGVDMKLQKQSLAQALSDFREGRYPCIITGWTGRLDPSLTLALAYSSTGSSNFGKIDLGVDQMIDDLQATFDKEERIDLVKEIIATVAEAGPPQIALIRRQSVVLVGPNVEGFEANVSGKPDLRAVSLR